MKPNHRLAILLALCGAVWAQQRPRVAVMDFDYGAVKTSAAAYFNANADLGRGIRNLAVEKLVNGQKYSVIDRANLDKVLAEQNFNNGNRADPRSASAIGKLLGVDAIVTGTITKFGRDDSSTRVTGGGGNVGSGLVGGLRRAAGRVGVNNARAVVAITAQIVSVSTGEILATASGEGESTRRSATVDSNGANRSSGGFGEVDLGKKDFADTMIGEATTMAVDKLAASLGGQASRVPAPVRKIEGLVADYTGGIVTLNVGAKDGVAVGMTLSIKKPGREIRNPATGKVIRRIEESLGTVTISEIGDAWSSGRFTGTAALKGGEIARLGE